MLSLRFVRRLSNMPLFGEAIREQFVERVQQEHTCWNVETRTTANTSNKPQKSCAVLIPLVNIRGRPCMLFTQRALVLRNYSGAVCFPGGHLEPNECPEQGALRESYEEIGLDVEKVNIWGKLSPVYNNHLKCKITPVVGLIKEANLKKLKAECNEVRTVFVVSVGELCSNKTYTKFKNGGTEYISPVFTSRHYEVVAANGESPREYRIWGLSAETLQKVLTLLFPEQCKSRNESLTASATSAVNATENELSMPPKTTEPASHCVH